MLRLAGHCRCGRRTSLCLRGSTRGRAACVRRQGRPIVHRVRSVQPRRHVPAATKGARVFQRLREALEHEYGTTSLASVPSHRRVSSHDVEVWRSLARTLPRSCQSLLPRESFVPEAPFLEDQSRGWLKDRGIVSRVTCRGLEVLPRVPESQRLREAEADTECPLSAAKRRASVEHDSGSPTDPHAGTVDERHRRWQAAAVVRRGRGQHPAGAG